MTSRFLRACAFALLPLLAAAPALAFDESDLLPVDEAFVLEATAPQAGEVQFRFAIAEGYYLYRHRFAAQPLDPGASAGALQLPAGEARNDEFFGDVEIYRHHVTATLPEVVTTGAQEARFRIRYQGCADAGICYPPQSREVTVTLPASTANHASLPLGLGNTAPAPASGFALGGLTGTDAPTAGMDADAPLPAEEAFQFEAIAVSPVELLLRFTPAPGYYLYRDRNSFRLPDAQGVQPATPQWPAGVQHSDEHFGDVVVYFDQIEVPLGLRRSRGDAGPITLEATFQGCQTDGICYPPMTRQVRIELPQASPEQLVSTADTGKAEGGDADNGLSTWLKALLLALGGGLILNLMPCVLPVLSLKALSLTQSGESQGKARRHALWYTAGVLVSFGLLGIAALALRQLGLAMGWGFQLQQPLVVAALAYVMAAVGLSLSGVFSIGSRWAGVGQGLAGKSGPAGDFFTGVLAVVVASPCTAPLMGPALAFAFAASPALALSVFLALGVGLALPFLLIGFVPALAQRLPRPGAWMETLKQVLAFPMYLTAVWLLWVLGQQRGVDALGYALAGIVVLALALWRWEKARWGGGIAARGVALALLVLALWPLWKIPALEAPAAASIGTATATPYSAERLETLRAEGRTVFVNMTADWCVTCKFNEKRVLDTDGFRDLLARHDVVYMKGDWTNVDPTITAFLESHGSVGVPLYVVISSNRPDAVLPTVLTLDMVEHALERERTP
ncbi:protein-disulfide reductase DsbD [Xanthomonadaceae bacterium XH05]|nr:protein-disulfide reductase DsbD [Xanthomonadaceae bacterium XH05]